MLSPRRISLCLAAALLLITASSLNAQPQSADFDARLAQVTQALTEMGTEPGNLKSVNYHLVYLGDLKAATERRNALEAVRRNYLGFMRRMGLKPDMKTGKQLVIVVETYDQMKEFQKRSQPGAPAISDRVAGFYSPADNWAIFYDQRQNKDVQTVQARLNKRLASVNAPKKIGYTTTRVGGVRIGGIRAGGVTVGGRGSGGSTTGGTITVKLSPQEKQKIINEVQAEWQQIMAAANEINVAITQHEGAHQLAFNTGIQKRGVAYPFWVSEGLACVFESPPKGARRGASRTNGLRLGQYRKAQSTGKALGLAKLIALPPEPKGQDVDNLYAESWAAFDFLFKRYAKPLKAYMNHLTERNTPQGSPQAELADFQKFFEKPLETLQLEFDKYIERMK